MADKPAGRTGRKADPDIADKPADQGPNNGVPEELGDEHPKGTPTSHQIQTERAAREK